MERCPVMSDRELTSVVIAACQQGDREAFRVLFERYKDKVYSIAYHFSGDEALAKDVSQQVFLKLFTALAHYRAEAEFTTWLYRLVVNACLDEQRKRKRFIFFEDAGEISEKPARHSQEVDFMKLELADSVKAAIAELKAKLRLAILLKYFEELSYEEMATVLDCSMGTVASRLNRAHKSLAQKLAHLRGTFVEGE